MEYALGVTVVKTLGVDFTIGCIKAVTASAQGIYGLVSSLKNSLHAPDVGRVIKGLDLEADVPYVETLLTEIESELENHYTETLAGCVKSLKECVENIELNLTFVKNRMSYNKSLWLFSTMRSYDFDDIIEELKVLKMNLDNRKKTLIETLKINNLLKIKKKQIVIE